MEQHQDTTDPADVARRAANYCRMNFPSGWKAGTPAWNAKLDRWVIPVVLDTTELGQLSFDGETMRLLTPRQTMVERARAS
jgi:hypothetical protein